MWRESFLTPLLGDSRHQPSLAPAALGTLPAPGIWGELQTALAPSRSDCSAAATLNAVPPPLGVWQALALALDVSQRRPHQAAGVIARELTDRRGAYYVLKQPQFHTYLRLSTREFWLWQRMDGTRTVQELVVS